MAAFKISACSASYGRADLFTIVDRLAALEYDGIEITVMYHAVPAETSAARRAEILRRVRQAGLVVSALHFIFPPGLKMTAEAAEDRRRVVDHVGTVIELARDLGSPFVVIGGGGMRSAPSGIARSVAVDRVIEVFSGIARLAEPTGVVACIEVINRLETNIGRSFAECSDYLDRIGSPAVKLAGDTFHMNIDETSMPGAIIAAGPRLAHLHLPDSHRLAPGGGHIDFPPILKALQEISFAGFLSFELCWIAPDLPYLASFELCDAECVKAIRYVRELERRL